MKEKFTAIAAFLVAHRRVVIIAVSAILLILILIFIMLQAPEDGKIARGVSMDDIDLSGMTIDEATEALSVSTYYSGIDSFTIASGTESVDVTSAEISLGTDTAASAESAFAVGRSSNFFSNAIVCLGARLFGKTVNPSASVDSEKLDAILYDLGVQKNGEMKEAVCTDLSETSVKVTPPTKGQSKDVSAEREEVLSQLEDGNFDQIEVSLPLTDPGALTAEEVYAVVYRPSADAQYQLEGKELYIVDETVGIEADKSEIEQKLSEFNSGNEITLTVTKLVPEKTAASLRDGLFSAELSSYSSTFSTAAANRAFNVSRAAASVNGTILLPGDTFSYNTAIGNPSLENGYKVAPVYENGKTSEGVGGGVCQVSSTIYSAVLYANLEIVERRSHSLTVAYVPKGQDATVAYGSIDFKFKNNTEKPIRIDVTTQGGKCVVKVIGTAPAVAQSVKIENTVVATTEPTVVETNDPTLPQGKRQVTSTGKTGYVVDSVRIVSQNGEVVKTEKLTRSTYKMIPTEVSVGTMATPEPTAAPAAAQPSESTPVESTTPSASPSSNTSAGE